MKTVGIITMHQVRNYGSFAQAYATQRSIEKLGYKVEIINYTYPNDLHGTKKSTKAKILHLLNVLTKSFIPGMPHRKFEQHYQEVFRDYYHLSASYSSRESILKNPPIYDVYVVGSDQVWNDKFVAKDDTFFLGFAPKCAKKIAFASSFGKKKIDDANVEAYKERLKGFDKIAIRESSGVALAKELTGREDIYKVMDPSFLLNSSEWRELAVPFERSKQPYIFVYGSHCHEYMLETANKIANEKGWAVYKVNGNIIDYYNREVHCLLDIGPREWMGLIDNAEMVFACSFHGVAFSIQFNTPFFAVFTGNEQFDSRLDSLLKELSLEKHCLLRDTSCVDLNNAYEENWNCVNSKLLEKRIESIDVLNDFLA